METLNEKENFSDARNNNQNWCFQTGGAGKREGMDREREIPWFVDATKDQVMEVVALLVLGSFKAELLSWISEKSVLWLSCWLVVKLLKVRNILPRKS